MRWERLALARTWLFSLAGFAALAASAFLWSPIAGWAAVGISLLLVEYLSSGQGSAGGATPGAGEVVRR